jgi:type I restriction enzyme, S subunit
MRALVPLGELTSLISSGSTPLGGATNYADCGEVMLVRSQNVRMRSLELGDVAFVSRNVADRMARTYLKRGDALLNITGASIGRTALFDLDTVSNVNQHVCVIRPKVDRLDGRYLVAFLASPSMQQRIMAQQNGGTRQALTFQQIAGFEVPLPPLLEQRRIADILDKAYAIRRKRKEAIDLTEDLLRSTFLDMFGDPVTNPKGWNVKPLEELVDQLRGISYGVVQRGPEVADGIPVVRISNFGDNRFDVANVVRTSSEISNSFRRTILRGGELVVSIRGTVGRVAVVPGLASGWNVSREVAVIPLLDGVSRALVHRALLSDDVQRFILGNVKGVAQSGINLSDLRQAPIPCPPQREVDRFERAALTIADMERSIVSASARSEDLFNTLVQEAFSKPTPREVER